MPAVSRPLRGALAAMLLPCVLAAQGPSTVADDALVLARGRARIGVAPTWIQWASVFTEDGSRAPLGMAWASDTLGERQLPVLAPLRDDLEEITGQTNLRLTLGRLAAERDATILSFPIALEVGIGGRLSLGAVVPIVRTRSFAYFVLNPQAGDANVGLNPALDNPAAQAQNEELFTQFAQAIGALEQLIAACQNPGNPDPRCPQARSPEAQALLSTAGAFTAGLNAVYDDERSAFVPLADSPIDQLIRARIATFASSFATYDITVITADGPAGAALAGYADGLRLISDPAFGLAGEPLLTRTRTSLGDIEVGAKLQILGTVREDSLGQRSGGVRFAVAGVYRFGTGDPDDPDDFADVASGDGQNDIEGRAYWDVSLGSRLALSVIGRYAVQLADREIARIAEPSQPFPERWRRQEVERDLGDVLEIDAMPRLAIGDFFSFIAQYRFRRKGADRHTGEFDAVDDRGENVVLDASVLDLATRQEEHRLSLGLGYSTLASVVRKRSRIPLEIYVQYGRSVRGSGGRTPRVSVGAMHLRLYPNLF